MISMSFSSKEASLPPGACPGGAGIIGGNVFNDPNFNGVEDDGMLGLEGIEVFIYESNAVGTSVLVDNTTTDANGDYYFSGLTDGNRYRVEFFAPASLSAFKPTFDASNSMTTVQYPTSPSCDVDAGFGCPADFCGADFQTLDVVVPCYIAGDPLAGGTAGNDVGIVAFPYTASGSGGTQNTTVLETKDVGSLWGMTYETTDRTFYGASTLRRHVGYGPGGTGAIYAIDGTDLANASVISTIDLDALGFDTGTDPRIGEPLPADKEDASFDIGAFPLVGKMSYGDIEISSDGKDIYAMNLLDKTVYKIFVDVPFTQPTAADVTPIPVPDPGCVGGEYRPWGLEFYKGKLYVGVVCDASTSQNAGDLHAYVYEHDPAGAPNNFTTVLDFPLDFERGEVFFIEPNSDQWYPWTDNFNDLISTSGFLIRPQPILSDIEFESDGSMILGFMDRTGHQAGYLNYGTNTADQNLFTAMTGGDILKACKIGGNFVLEGPASCTTAGGAGSNQGPGGNEFFFDEIWPAGSGPNGNGSPTVHGEIAQGGLAVVPGTGDVVSTVFDPLFDVNAGGVIIFDTDTGVRETGYEVVIQTPGSPGKSNQLGDLSFDCPTAPIEVGNYVWIDSNMDGIQDPGETPIPGVNVALFNETGTQLATTMTDADGEYYFNNGDVAGLNFFENYFIVVGLNQFNINDLTLFDTLVLTIDSTGMGMDTNLNDSDGEIGSPAGPAFAMGYPYTPFSTGGAGCNDHSLDFGFNAAPCEIVIDAVTSTDETCFGSVDGEIMISVTATNPVEYSIDNGMTFQNGNTFTGLSAGAYRIVVRERGNVNCAETARTRVNEGLRIDPPTGVTGFAICTNEPVPAGGGLVANCAACAMGASNLTWHTAATGGTNVGSGSPFDPVAAGQVDASVVGTTTFYAQCACGVCVSPRVPADFIVRPLPEPTIAGAPFVCPGATETYTTPFFGGSTYIWTLSGGGTIVARNNNEIEIEWTTQEGAGPFTVSVTESTEFGCMASADFLVETKNVTLACNDEVQISLDAMGMAVVDPDQILEGTYNTFDCFTVDITDQFGNSLGNKVDCRHLDQNLIVTITGDCDLNSCWSTILVEDKVQPVIDCPTQPYRLTCLDDHNAVPAPVASDNCSIKEINLILEENTQTDRCVLGEIRRTYIAADHNGLESLPCTVVIELLPPADPKFPEDITWTCEQFKAFPNIVEATDIHEYLFENAGLLDRTNLYCIYENGDDQNFSVPYDARFNYWLDNEDLDVPLDPRYDDNIDNPDTDPDAANCGTASRETDQLTNSYNISFMVGCPYLTDCNTTPDAHEPTFEKVPVYNSSVSWRGLEDADILAMTGSGVPDIQDAFCPYVTSFSDQKIATCAPADSNMMFKILRTWTVLNWCTGETISDIQVIKVLDKIAPEIEAEALEVTANINAVGPEGECVSTQLLAAPTITDNCSSEWTVQIFTSVGELDYVNGVDGKEGGYIPSPGLPIGNHAIQYYATDACGNRSERTGVLSVIDGIKPTMVCRELTEISLSSDGMADLCAEKVDEGSSDNCGIEKFLIRKMDESSRDFRECVTYSCDDTRDTVILRAFDYYGNFNDCMVEVKISDKLAPDCKAPDDVWINCNDNRGTDYSDTTQLQALFGNAYWLDNCHAYTEELAPNLDLDLCGVGTITRSFRSVDWVGNRSRNRCSQTIMIMPVHDYKLSIPGDFEEECDDAAPADLTFEENACDLLAVNVEDQDFPASPLGECKKVFRTWKVINWCEYDGASAPYELPRRDLNRDGIVGDGIDGSRNSVTGHNFNQMHMYKSNGNLLDLNDGLDNLYSTGYYIYTQHVKIFDNTAPELSYNGDLEFCGGERDEDPCTGRVELPLDIIELCTNTSTRWELTTGSDVFGTSSFNGNGTFSGRYPLGVHTLRYFVEDECGNISTIDITFEIVDCKAPTPVCHNGLSIELMQTGMVDIWATDFDASSFDYCSSLEFRINHVQDINRDGVLDANDYETRVPTTPSITFDCDDLDLNIVQMWVGDDAGNWDFCTAIIDVQDNQGVCGAGSKIAGTIATDNGTGVKDVKIELSGNNANSVMTDANGAFNFASVAKNQDYTITPVKNDDVANGVSTYDLLLISKHILNVQPLANSYKMIAADANNSGNISTLDLIELRKVILRVQNEFTNNTSWRFIEKGHIFVDANNPFGNFPEAINYNNLSIDELTTDFMAVKIGDVNGDADANGILGVDGRTNPNAQNINVENQTLIAGEATTVRFEVENASEVLGYQFTLDFDPTLVQFENLIENDLVKNQNFGYALLDDGAITASWSSVEKTDKLFFEMTFSALKNTDLKTALKINSRYTRAEAYPTNGDFKNVTLKFNDTETTDGFALHQNKPNPFNGKTVIGFELPEATDATITIFDLSGKVIQLLSGNYSKGYNEVNISNGTLPSEGIYYYRLETATHAATRKMMFLE